MVRPEPTRADPHGPSMALRRRMSTLRIERFVRTSIWLLPVGCLAGGTLVAVATLALGRSTKTGWCRRA